MSHDRLSSEGWRACYQELAPRLLLFARQWVPSLPDAEDVVQAAFIRFWRKQPHAQREHYPLLYAAVRSAALDLLRANARRARREDTFHAENTGGSLSLFNPGMEQQEAAATVQAALQAIPPEQREAVVLRIWGELSFAEIAQAVGVSINTAASRYRYAVEAMRKQLQPHEYERV